MSPSSYTALEGEEISFENKALFCFARFNEVEGQRGAANNQQKIQMCKVAPAASDDASAQGAGGPGFTWQDAGDMLSFLCQHIM